MLAVCFGAMKTTAVVLLMLAASAVSRPSGLDLRDCEEDHECSDNMFCYKLGNCIECEGNCVDCYNCELYYRKPSHKKKCAREPSECGACLDGYEAEILTNGNERDYCRNLGKVAPELTSGPALSSKEMFIVGSAITAVVLIIACFVIHRWRKMRFRGGDQTVQGTQESRNAGSGNGMSPLLGGVNERKAYLEEQTSCSRPSAPPHPPPYEGSLPSLRDEATFVMNRIEKCQEAVCLREPTLQITSFPAEEQVEEPDEQSTDGSDIDVTFHPDINFESGYPSAFHDDDTLPASHDGNHEIVEQPEVNMPSNAEAPSFLGVLGNTGVTNSGGSETCDLNDSGLSQASSSISLSSSSADEAACHSVERGNPSSRSETLHADGCKPEQRIMKRSRHTSEDEEKSSHVADAPFDGALLHIEVPNSDSEAQEVHEPSISQASSSTSFSSNAAGPHSHTERPVAKRQKFDSGNSSTAEDLQEDEDTHGSQESPRTDTQATVYNIQNVVNYNIQNTFNIKK